MLFKRVPAKTWDHATHVELWLEWIDQTVPEKQQFLWNMPGQQCCVCGNSRTKDPRLSFHHFPNERMNLEMRAVWLREFGMREEHITTNSRVCLRHFTSGEVLKSPAMTLGKQFASPIKKGERASDSAIRAIAQMFLVNGSVYSLESKLYVCGVVPSFRRDSLK